MQHLNLLSNPQTLTGLLKARASEQPAKRLYSFLLDDGSEVHLSYAELLARAQLIAAHLQQNLPGAGTNAQNNSRVLILLPPGLDLIAAFFGCLLAGMIAVPLPPPHPARLSVQKDRVLSVASDAQPAIVLSDIATRLALEPIANEINTCAGQKIIWLECDRLSSSLENDWREPDITGETTAFLQYTSGSTSHPKGVMVSHANLIHNNRLIHHAFGHHPEGHGVIWLPPYHDMGLIGGILQPLYGGFSVSLLSPASFLMKPSRWLQTITRTHATTSGAPNFAYELCALKITEEQKEQLDLSSWEVAFVGAEPVRSETIDRFARAFEGCGFRREAFLPCYGLAEATLLVSGKKQTAAPQIVEKNGIQFVGCGQAASELDVRIANLEQTTLCKEGEIGEIFVSGKSVTTGYWNRPLETAGTFQTSLPGIEHQEFLRTGDLGFFQNGELFVCGREKDLILIAGRNHFPEDIERNVEADDDAIRASAAFSMDIEGQERLIIAVEIDRLSTLDEAQKMAVISRIKSKVATCHDLRIHDVLLHRVGGLPRTTSGKIQRAECRRNYLTSHNNKETLDIPTVPLQP